MTDSPGFSLTVRQTAGDGQTAVHVMGDVDLTTAEELDREVRAQMLHAPVLLDLSGVSFMDSSGLRVLDALVRHSRAGGGQLSIDARLPGSVAQILELTGMTKILPFAEPG